MRAAIQFSNVIRRALHNKKAGMIQRQVRRMIGLHRVRERRKRFSFVYDRLLGLIRATIQSLSCNTSGAATPCSYNAIPELFATTMLEENSTVQKSRMDVQVEAFDFSMCSLVALGKYDLVRRIGSAMAVAAHYEENVATSIAVNKANGRGCVGTEAELALTVAYLGLSACWSRVGRRRYTRLDFMEEALGLMMQHSAAALAQAQQSMHELTQRYSAMTAGPLMVEEDSLPYHNRSLSRRLENVAETASCSNANQLDQVVSAPHGGLPAWLLALEEDTVDLYYMAVLAMKGVTSPYDAMLLTAEWVWYQACVHEHNAAADDMVVLHEMHLRRSRQKKRLWEGVGAPTIGNVQRRSTTADSDRATVGGNTRGLFSLADIVVARTAEDAEAALLLEECSEPEVDPIQLEQERRFAAAAAHRVYAVRRVYALLQRAQRLLSAESLDRKEIADRIDLFHDLHMTEQRVLLVDTKACPFPFRAHFYTTQEAIDRQRMASKAAANAKQSGAAEAELGKSIVSCWQGEIIGTGNLEVDLQVILCGKSVLIKGSVLLHRLVEAADDLPSGSTLPSSSSNNTDNRKSRSTHEKDIVRGDRKSSSCERSEDVIVVAVRPMVLMRAEVTSMIERIKEELGLIEHAVAAAAQDEASETNSASDSLTSSKERLSMAEQGAEGQTKKSVSSQQGAQDGSHHHSRSSGRGHHGHTMGEYERLAEYIQKNLRLVSCQEAHWDPFLAHSVRVMRERARKNTDTRRFDFAPKDGVRSDNEKTAYIPPLGIPSVRFSIPVVEYQRKIFNESQTVVHATHLLQRVYRGYRGRAKFRRMRWKRMEYERQAQGTLDVRGAHDRVRRWRGNRLTVLQRLFRGYRWRKRLHALRCAVLVVQCAFRIFRARGIMEAERRRRREGAPVVPMLGQGRGVQVGDRKFTLKIFRSGTNYRLEGVDLLRGAVYEGAVYTAEVMRLITEHNNSIKGETLQANSLRIMPWQHERVVELIIANLGLMPKILAVTAQFGARSSCNNSQQYILVTNKNASLTATAVVSPATYHQLTGSASQSVLDVATAHTQKQRLQRYAQFRQNIKYNRHLTK